MLKRVRLNWSVRTIYGVKYEMFDHSSDLPDSTANTGTVCDVVSELLVGMRLQGLEYQRLQITPPFAVSYGEDPTKAQFHFVAQGHAYLHIPDKALHRLSPGDAVLLPRGGLHALLSRPALECQKIGQLDARLICDSVKDIVACCPNTPHEDRVL